MKIIFIVNPKSGQGKNVSKFIDSINDTIKILKEDAEIYITKSIGDAERFVSEYCKTKGVARFIACGGDGTLSEVVNGAIKTDGVEVGVIPRGTGNDFCRNFNDAGDFSDIKSQITGKSVKCDTIKYKTKLNGKEKTGYCVNMFNIGFDCNVVDMTADMKKKPLISGSFAYFLSILVNLIKKRGANLKIKADGITLHNGALLLTSVANGAYCGGGVLSNPLSSVRDGFINVNIIKNISRLRFIYLLPHYMKGTFLKLKNINEVITTLKCKKLVITPLNGKMRLCVDGEISDAEETEFEIVQNSLNFVIP